MLYALDGFHRCSDLQKRYCDPSDQSEQKGEEERQEVLVIKNGLDVHRTTTRVAYVTLIATVTGMQEREQAKAESASSVVPFAH